MKIQYLNGGLANQIFQYIFVRFAELHNPSAGPWYIDDSFFFVHHVHNGYELEKIFGIRANLLSKYFEPDLWEFLIQNKMNGISIPQSLKNLKFEIQMIAETANYTEHNPFDGKVWQIPSNEFHPEITKLPGEIIYYHGYWINTQWFRAYQETLRKELSFPPIVDGRNRTYAKEIISTFSIGVHIRRGDYVTIGWALSIEYYRSSMKELTEQYPDAVFYVFSDDLVWCRANADSLGLSLSSHIVYVEGNTGSSSFIDLQLMSMCKGLLMSNSAFCYLSALLDKNLAFCKEPKMTCNWR